MVNRLDAQEKILLAAGIVALPAYLLFFSSGNFNYLIGVNQLLKGQSLYGPEFVGSANPFGAKIYVYLPVFAIANAVPLAPVYFILKVLVGTPNPTVGGVQNTVFIAAGLATTGFWAYLSLLAIPYSAKYLFDNASIRRIATLILISFPLLWVQTIASGTNSLVALLAMAGLISVRQHRFRLAGLFVGLSTFKFNGLPFALVLFLYVLYAYEIKYAFSVAIGGIASQIPNIVYFLVFPDDLYMIIRRRGALSAHAHEIGGIFLSPVKATGVQSLYIDIVFPVLIGLCVIIGVFVAVRSDAGLPAGLAVGFLSTSYFVPGEHRILPFLLLLLVLAVPVIKLRVIKALVVSVFVAASYYRFVTIASDSFILGLTSEHIEYIGISDISNVLFFILQLTALLSFFVVVYYIERSDWAWTEPGQTSPLNSGRSNAVESENPAR